MSQAVTKNAHKTPNSHHPSSPHSAVHQHSKKHAGLSIKGLVGVPSGCYRRQMACGVGVSADPQAPDNALIPAPDPGAAQLPLPDQVHDQLWTQTAAAVVAAELWRRRTCPCTRRSRCLLLTSSSSRQCTSVWQAPGMLGKRCMLIGRNLAHKCMHFRPACSCL